jgi:hypothetical protein
MMKNRFDLEDEISSLYSLSANLETLSEGILEYDLEKDEIVNVLEGIKVLLTLQASKLMDTMTQCFKLDQYRDYTDHDAKIDTYS